MPLKLKNAIFMLKTEILFLNNHLILQQLFCIKISYTTVSKFTELIILVYLNLKKKKNIINFLALANDEVLADVWYNVGHLALGIGDVNLAYQCFRYILSSLSFQCRFHWWLIIAYSSTSTMLND